MYKIDRDELLAWITETLAMDTQRASTASEAPCVVRLNVVGKPFTRQLPISGEKIAHSSGTLKMKIALIVVLTVAGFLMTGCTTPDFRKVEMYEKQIGTPFVKDANYLVLARYWDDHAEKQMIDFKGASFLNVREEEGRAEITIGNGPYYGMIELKSIDGGSTLITTYAWGYLATKILEWEGLLRGFTPANKK